VTSSDKFDSTTIKIELQRSYICQHWQSFATNKLTKSNVRGANDFFHFIHILNTIIPIVTHQKIKQASNQLDLLSVSIQLVLDLL
jgi:hypothetical protein